MPLKRPLRTSGGSLDTAPFVLLDLRTDQGLNGLSYIFCYTMLVLKPLVQLVRNLEAIVVGATVAPFKIESRLQNAFRLVGPQGLTGMALAGIDMAVWDILAKGVGQPLCRLLGGPARSMPVYNSNGLGLIGAEKAAHEAAQLVGEGFDAIKIRLGYPDIATDLSVVHAIRSEVGPNVRLMVDYNQSLSVQEAIERGTRLDTEDILWMEEPVLATDLDGHAAVRAKIRTPVQTGENWWGPADMQKAIAAGASDFGMCDVIKIGGVTGWQRAAALARKAELPLSSHLFPEISAHLLSTSRTGHWLEYVDWANPFLQQPLAVTRGKAAPSEGPGSGLAWNEDAVEFYLV